MVFVVQLTPDGNCHVQNMVGGYLGQHHVHTEAGFEKWKKGVSEEDLRIARGRCSCGLKPSQVREYDGKVWQSNDF